MTMDKIIKTTTGDASFVLEEQFEDETKAEKGTDPVSQEVKEIEIKIDNIKWRKKDNE
jgi:hypothetical protein